MTLPRFTFTDRARPFLELGVGDSRIEGQAARWDVQRWDVAGSVWSGVEPDWQDVTCQAFQVTIVEGRDRAADRFAVGTMTVVASNLTGWADLEAPDPDDLNTLQLRPGRSIRFGVEHVELGRRVLFRGFVDVVTPSYEPGSNVVTLDCIDALGEVGRVRIVDPSEEPTHGGEEVDARLDRILDEAQWPPSKRDFEGSSATLLPVRLDGQAADLLGIASDSVGGSVFGDTDGDVAWRALDWQAWPRDRDPDGVIGNVEEGDVCPVRWERPFARDDMSNVVHLANRREPDPDRAEASDSDSWALYGVETFERTDLDTEDPALLDRLAARYLQTRGPDTIPRIRSVSLDGRTGDPVVDLLAASTPYLPSRYRCRLRLLRGLVFDDLHLLTGVSHDIDPDAWNADLLLDLAEPWAMIGTARWEPASGVDAGRSQWDRVTWN